MTAEAADPHHAAPHHADSSPAKPPSDHEAAPAGFAAALRGATQTVHREAERSGYIADLLRGRATLKGYAVYLLNLKPAYAAMERHLSRSEGPPARRAFAAPGLFRTAALTSDIRAIVGVAEEGLPILPEAEAYAAAVERAAEGEGFGLVAHAYARYLGDLSGGQILKSLLARTLDLRSDQLAFYDFPEIADIAAYKTALRDALDTIDPSSPEAASVIAEAIAAFRHTIDLSEAVSRAMTPD